MAKVALGEFCFDKFIRGALHHLLVETLLQLVKKRAVSLNEARFEQRRADGEVLARQTNAIINRTRRMANLEAEIPERIEHVFDHALAPGRLLVGKQEKKIDVGTRRQRAAPVPADSRNRNALRLARIGGGEYVVGRESIKFPDDRVLKVAKAFGAGASPVCPLLQPLPRLAAPRREGRFQHRHDAAFQRQIIPGLGGKRVQLFADICRIGNFEHAGEGAAHKGKLLETERGDADALRALNPYMGPGGKFISRYRDNAQADGIIALFATPAAFSTRFRG